jgi:hypothetical protein
VPSSLLTLIACSPIMAGWLAIYGCRFWAVGRQRRQEARRQAEWARLTARLSELDAHLDRAWAAEQERIRRYR